MRQVVSAGKWTTGYDGKSGADDIRLGSRKLLRIANLQVVAQHTGAWIDIRILRHQV
jgi:hypothetical protein